MTKDIAMKPIRFILAVALLADSALAVTAQVPVVLNSAGKPIEATATMSVDSSGAYVAGAGGDASAANQTAVQANAGSDATKATAVQGITGGKAVPVSAATLPLPAGASTEATLSAVSGKLPSSLGAKSGANSLSFVPATDAGLATSSGQTTANTSLSDIAASVATLEDKVDTLILNIGDPTDTAAANGTVTGSIFAFAKASLIAAQDTTPTPVSISQTSTANDVDVVTSALPTGAATQTTLSAIDTKLAGTLTVSSTSTSGTPIVPATATATTGTLLGGQYNSTMPTFTDGQQGALRTGTRGSLKVELCATNSASCVAVDDYTGDTIGNGVGLLVDARCAVWNSSLALVQRCRTVGDGYNSPGSGIPAQGLYAQCDDTSPTATTEGNYSNVRVSCSNHTLLTRPYESQANSWTYAAASGGISNTTTAVTIKAAAAAGLKNCTLSLQLSAPTLGAATEVAIRDGAGGTVLWRGYMSTAGGNQSAAFSPPICGTAATLTEIVTLTATVTGAVYANAQGYIAP